MAAFGCLLLLVLPLLGAVAGGWIGGAQGSGWGAGIGFIVAVAICGAGGLALVQAGKRG